MLNNRIISPVLTFPPFILIAALALSNPANANLRTLTDSFDLLNASCPTRIEQSIELDKLKHEIIAAETVDQARVMALQPTDAALNALSKANTMLPWSDELNAAKTRLNQSRIRILTAASQRQVADEFSGIMLAGLDDNAANVGVGKAECHYTTGEVVAIVIGLILGIIPGLILLVLLC